MREYAVAPTGSGSSDEPFTVSLQDSAAATDTLPPPPANRGEVRRMKKAIVKSLKKRTKPSASSARDARKKR